MLAGLALIEHMLSIMSQPEGPLLPHGGYRKLRSYEVPEAVYDATVVFYRRFLAHDHRLTDQMAQDRAPGPLVPAGGQVTPIRLGNSAATRNLLLICWLALDVFSSFCGAAEAAWQAGTARTSITPTTALWMAGYASRDHPAEGKATELWLKALALQDAAGHRGVVVTLDVVGIKQPIYYHVRSALKEKFGLGPEQFVLCASHTHCGPLLRGSSRDTYPITEDQQLLVNAYSDELEHKIVDTVGNALAAVAPARLAAGQGGAGFAVNRRNNPEDVEQLIASGTLKGPVDHSVPVLTVSSTNGELRAVLFGYACHNTTMAFYEWCGDYAGFAQTALEESHPGATAMFFMGCAGDQNPLPRRRLELAQRYGRMLASAVEEVLLTSPANLKPQLEIAMEAIPLDLGPAPTAPELEKLKSGSDPTVARWATRLLSELRDGKHWLRAYPYPIQAWRFGARQLWITLGGEPVVDYALWFKRQFGQQTWVAGYCNEVMTYIPSTRVLNEDKPPLASTRWGYEGSRALMISGLPAYRWANGVEERIATAVTKLVERFQLSDRSDNSD